MRLRHERLVHEIYFHNLGCIDPYVDLFQVRFLRWHSWLVRILLYAVLGTGTAPTVIFLDPISRTVWGSASSILVRVGSLVSADYLVVSSSVRFPSFDQPDDVLFLLE